MSRSYNVSRTGGAGVAAERRRDSDPATFMDDAGFGELLNGHCSNGPKAPHYCGDPKPAGAAQRFS